MEEDRIPPELIKAEFKEEEDDLHVKSEVHNLTCQFQMQFPIQFTKYAQHSNSMIAGDISKEQISLTNSNSKLRQIVISKVEWMKNSYAFKIC